MTNLFIKLFLLAQVTLVLPSASAATQEDLLEYESLSGQLKFYQPDHALPYSTEYKNALAEFEHARPSTENNLWQSLRGERLILVGDIHSTKIPQQNFLTLLERTISPHQKNALVLEFLPAEMMEMVEAYLSGAISESEFFAQINEIQYWPFPMGEYLNILRFAKAHSMGILLPDTIDREASAAERDQRIIQSSSRALSRFDKVYVFFGTSHLLGKDHLRDGFIKQLKIDPAVVIPENDGVFWEGNLGKAVDSSVFRLKDKVFLYSPHSPNQRLRDSLIYYRGLFGFE